MAEAIVAFSIIAAALAGVATGLFTGILPGLHINLVAAIVASHFNGQGSLVVAAFIMAMSISHVFHEFIPSVFLGFSESDAALAVLPGHRLLLSGKGRKAVLLAALGGLSGIAAVTALSPLLFATLKPIFLATKEHIGIILGAIIAFHFLRCKSIRNAAINLLMLALSGAFGIAVFNLPSLKEPLLPMFAGLFGISSLIGGAMGKPEIPFQNHSAELRTKKPLKLAKLLAIGLISSSVMGLFPALGPAQAAMLGTATLRKLNASSYMFLLGVISSASMLFAILTLYAFGKARNGSIAVMGELIRLDLATLWLLLIVAVVAAAASFVTAAYCSRIFSSAVKAVNYRLLCISTIAAIALLVAFFSGAIGLLVLSVAAAIGSVPILLKSSRQLLMGCLMIPVIGYYL